MVDWELLKDGNHTWFTASLGPGWEAANAEGLGHG